jgi:hypothetical protein
MKPHLDLQSLAYFERVLQSTDTYIEYGCGGSTIRAIELGVKNVIVAESDPFWANKIKALAEPILNSDQSLHIELIDFGKTAAWGNPIHITEDKALAYVESVWDKADELGLRPTVVLIDGRFRVSCGCESILRCSLGTLIMLDDAFRGDYLAFRECLPNFERHGRLLSFKKVDIVDNAVSECKTKHILSKI